MSKRRDHLLIPDLQDEPGRTQRHFDWIGKYIAEKQPEVIVQIGDWTDMASLSSWDRGKKSFEGRRYSRDIESFRKSIERLESHFPKRYKPRKVFTCGNHEDRVDRYMSDNPEIDTLEHPMDVLAEYGWECYAFQVPVTVDGVTYAHLFPRTSKGTTSAASVRNGAASARAQVMANQGTTIAGHKQGLDIASFPSRTGIRWGIIAGSAYPFKCAYQGPQGQDYFRGILRLKGVRKGDFSLDMQSLRELKERYGK